MKASNAWTAKAFVNPEHSSQKTVERVYHDTPFTVRKCRNWELLPMT